MLEGCGVPSAKGCGGGRPVEAPGGRSRVQGTVASSRATARAATEWCVGIVFPAKQAHRPYRTPTLAHGVFSVRDEVDVVDEVVQFSWVRSLPPASIVSSDGDGR